MIRLAGTWEGSVFESAGLAQLEFHCRFCLDLLRVKSQN
jgi:hypothetical protein